MNERPNLIPQFLSPAESGATRSEEVIEAPAANAVNNDEVYDAKNGEYDDLVKLNEAGQLYNAAGNGKRSGKFISKQQAEIIMANADTIRDGQEEYAAAKVMSEAGAADSDIEAAAALRRLDARADELEAAAIAHIDEQYPADGVEPTVEALLDNAQNQEAEEDDDIAARDGESIDDYEERNGVPVDQWSTIDILDSVDAEEGVDQENLSTSAILDQVDQEEQVVTEEGFGSGGEGGLSQAVEQARESQEELATVPRTFRERVRDALTPAGFATEMGRFSSAAREKMTKRKKAGVVLGAVAVVGVAAWAVLNRDTHQGGGTFFADTLNTLDIDGASAGVQDMADQASERAGDTQPAFSNEAFNASSGEGWYQTFADMNIPVSERTALLDKIGPELVERGVAYQMGDSYGISQPGRLPEDVLQLIQDSRR